MKITFKERSYDEFSTLTATTESGFTVSTDFCTIMFAEWNRKRAVKRLKKRLKLFGEWSEDKK